MSAEIPTPKNVPNKLHEPYEPGNGWFPREPGLGLNDTLDEHTIQKRIHGAAVNYELPHPSMAPELDTYGNKTVDQILADNPHYAIDGMEPNEEQIREELEKIAGRPGDAEGLPKLGGKIAELDQIHEAISGEPKPGWAKRVKAFLFESQQFRKEFRLTKIQRDRKYLVKRAMVLMEISPRFESPDDMVLATLIAAHQNGLDNKES